MKLCQITCAPSLIQRWKSKRNSWVQRPLASAQRWRRLVTSHILHGVRLSFEWVCVYVPELTLNWGHISRNQMIGDCFSNRGQKHLKVSTRVAILNLKKKKSFPYWLPMCSVDLLLCFPSGWKTTNHVLHIMTCSLLSLPLYSSEQFKPAFSRAPVNCVFTRRSDSYARFFRVYAGCHSCPTALLVVDKQ